MILEPKYDNFHAVRPTPAHLTREEVAYVLDKPEREVQELLRDLPKKTSRYFSFTIPWYHWDDVVALGEPTVIFETLLLERHRKPGCLSPQEVEALGVSPDGLPYELGADRSRWFAKTEVEKAQYRKSNPDALTMREADAEFGPYVWSLPATEEAGEKWLLRSELVQLREDGKLERILDVNAVARLVGVSAPTIYRLASIGKIPSFKEGRRVRFRETEVRAALRHQPKRYEW